jgi:hypothetical protein
MAFFKRKQPAGRVQPPPQSRVEFDLAALQQAAGSLAAALAASEIDLELARARLADRCRDAHVRPTHPLQLGPMLEALDAEGRRRLALIVALLEQRAAADDVAALLGSMGPAVGQAVVGLAAATAPLTLELVRESPLRAQEFCRHLIAHFGAGVRGETSLESARQLERLDYGRLLEEADRAKMSAGERLEYLKKLQEQRAPRRGKW